MQRVDTRILPLGTVVVNPEPVDDGAKNFTGPEFRSRGAKDRGEAPRKRTGNGLCKYRLHDYIVSRNTRIT